MSDPRPSAIAVARAVVACEQKPGGANQGLQTLMTKLEAVLGKLIGSNGFDVLLARALKLAAREHGVLAQVTASAGGELAGLPDGATELEHGMVALLSHLSELLMKFIGEDLAIRVIREAWPAATHVESKETQE